MSEQQGEAWRDYVAIGFAEQRIGADFGVRNPISGGLNDSAFQVMRTAIEAEGHGPVQIFNERSGVQVFAADPPSISVSLTASGYAPRYCVDVVTAIHAAQAVDARMSASERLAYDLFASASPAVRRTQESSCCRWLWKR